MVKSLTTLIAGIAATLVVASTAQAALVQIAGDDLIFEYNDSTLFGTANVIGNTIFFNPTNFKVESLNGAGIATLGVTLNIDAWVKDGSDFVMSGASLYEEGDYKLVGEDSIVSVGGQLRATSLTQGGLFPYLTSDSILASGPLNTIGVATPWDASAAVDFGNVAGWDTDTHVRFTIENLLDATTFNLGDQAFIEKKFGAIGVEILPEVPLPAAAWLFGSALLGLGALKRRKA